LEKAQLSNIWCGSYKEAWDWRNSKAESKRVERMECSTCRGKDAVIWKVERNVKREIFCLPCRTGKKVPWWNWDGKLERTVPKCNNS